MSVGYAQTVVGMDTWECIVTAVRDEWTFRKKLIPVINVIL